MAGVSIIIGPLVERTKDHLLRKCNVIFSQAMLSKDWHKVVVINDKIQHVQGGLLVPPQYRPSTSVV